MTIRTFLPQEIIRKKRDGGALSAEDIGDFVAGLVSGVVTEMQASALAMAVFFQGMNRDEAVALTRAMRDSGEVLDWRGEKLGGPVLDKHSTGGVGDNVSLLLAPAVAACGGFVPMISGRGLGHTGGTLDKLDAIPGYRTQPDTALFRRTVREVGCAIIGQTENLAPADKRLYAIRDVTATVESIPLITASILSKKLAAGLGGLAMDVKTGSGAFMPTLERSRALAQSIVAVANGAGLRTSALITDMSEALAPVAGNALEVANAVDNLAGRRRDHRLIEVTAALGGEMLLAGGLVAEAAEGRRRILASLADGRAAEIFARMVVALGGPSDIVENPARHLSAAPVVMPVPAPAAGVVAAVETRALGLAVVALGGGRTRAADAIDPAVGLTDLVAIGEVVASGDPLGLVHARTEAAAQAAAATVQRAYRLAASGNAPPLVVERLGWTA